VKKILFVCHGNICRSVSAEFILKNRIQDSNLQDKLYCESRATSYEEIGNDIYLPMKRTLIVHHIPLQRHYASRITSKDYEEYDLVLLMDEENRWSIQRIIPHDVKHKIHMLTEYVGLSGEIEDPWYSGNYEKVYLQIAQCVDLLLNKMMEEGM